MPEHSRVSVWKMPKVTLMQFSDLHKSASVYDTNKALVSSLMSDMKRHSKELVVVPRPEILIVCGDIVQGSESSEEEIESQYEEAMDLLERLCERIFEGDRSRVVIVPGNHDVSWPQSKKSMERIEKYEPKFAKLMKEPRNNVRWNWEDGNYYKVSYPDAYNKRFLPFATFYASFYEDKRRYSLEPDRQYDIFEFPEQEALVVGFNSCFCNDHLNQGGLINPECIADCHTPLVSRKYDKWTKIAVWHHGIRAIPNEPDFMDERIVQFMIDKGFRIGLHGHQHRTDFFDVKFSADYCQRMLVLGCGTLLAPNGDLPLGETRQYSLIEFDKTRLRFHVRKGVNQPPDMPIWMPGNIRQSGDRSYMEVVTGQFAASGEVLEDKGETTLMELFKDLGKAEELIAGKEHKKALEILRGLNQSNPFVKRLTIECFFYLEMDKEIVENVKSPTTPTEFVHLSEALWRLRDYPALRKLVEELQNTPSIANSEQFKRIEAKLKDKGC